MKGSGLRKQGGASPLLSLQRLWRPIGSACRSGLARRLRSARKHASSATLETRISADSQRRRLKRQLQLISGANEDWRPRGPANRHGRLSVYEADLCGHNGLCPR